MNIRSRIEQLERRLLVHRLLPPLIVFWPDKPPADTAGRHTLWLVPHTVEGLSDEEVERLRLADIAKGERSPHPLGDRER